MQFRLFLCYTMRNFRGKTSISIVSPSRTSPSTLYLSLESSGLITTRRACGWGVGGCVKKKWNNSTSNASKVRSRLPSGAATSPCHLLCLFLSNSLPFSLPLSLSPSLLSLSRSLSAEPAACCACHLLRVTRGIRAVSHKFGLREIRKAGLSLSLSLLYLSLSLAVCSFFPR